MAESRLWVTTWAAPPQRAEVADVPEGFAARDVALSDTTVRQTLRVTIGGERLRLRLSNAFGHQPVVVRDLTVSLPAGDRAGRREAAGTSTRVSFNDRREVVIPPGALVVSDAVAMPVAPLTNLTVTFYLPRGLPSEGMTGHPGSRTTSHLARSDVAEAVDLPTAAPVDQWYLLSAVEVHRKAGSGAVAVLGDSLTDGRGSTTNGNDRWLDLLAERLAARCRRDRAVECGAPTAVVNAALGGNRVLSDGVGPNALARLDRDVLAQSGVSSLIVFHGINDIGTAPATPDAQQRLAADLLAAYEQIIARAHARNLRVLGATLTPFGGNEQYDDSSGLRESTRSTVNAWITGSGRFDEVIDFHHAVRDPNRPHHLLPEVDVGDHLHMNPRGYALLADAVPLGLLSA